MGGLALLFLCFYLFSFSVLRTSTTELNSITFSQSLRHGDTLVSAQGKFELGFFSPAKSEERYYMGLWHKNINPLKVVWVANRENPISDSSGSLNIALQGNLVITNGTNDIVWSSNVSTTVQ